MREVAKNRQNEQGQAIVEMVVGLIGIMIIFVGILSFSSLGVENIQYLITSRENADREVGGIDPQYIGDWNIWEPELNNGRYNIDDTVTSGAPADPDDFSSQLGGNGTIALVGNSQFATDPLVVGSQQDDIFLDASFLEGSRGNSTNMTEDLLNELGLMSTFRDFFGVNGIDFDQQGHNQVFMPTGLRNNVNP